MFSATGLSKQFIVVPNIVQIIDTLVRHIAHHTFILNTTVMGVNQYGKNVILTTSQGYTLQTHVAILATPIDEILKMSFSPELPTLFSRQKTARAYYVTNFEAEFDLPLWRANGYSGFILLYNPHFLCYQSKRNTLCGSIYHNHNDGTNTAEFILNRLNMAFGTYMRPTHWYQRTWLQSQIKDTLLTQLYNSIIFASSEFGFCYRNRMNGAVQAGQRAAILAISILRPQLYMKEDAYILRPAFESREIGFWRSLISKIMVCDIFFCIFVLTLLIASASI